MEVFGQVFGAFLDKNKSMFDFQIGFFIQNPRMRDFEAFYAFNKVANPDKKMRAKEKKIEDDDDSDQQQVFLGHDDSDTNERKPYHYDTLTERDAGLSVGAQVTLASSSKSKFTVTITLLKKKDHSVTTSFKGAAPDWLARNKAVFNGTLMLLEVKDLRPDENPGHRP
jgi:hypothetical protein